MFKSGYYITAELRLKHPGKLDEAKAALALLCQQSITEPGCSLFTAHHDAGQPNRFVLWERFDDEAAFKTHFDAPHTQHYIAQDLTEVVQYFQTDTLPSH
ncbi:putative quinol monooxygenase [Chitinimonas viridis]|uniref:Quinol monooxygenase n=1 Tax=Chitinimonas viridis TaxID=664880 RepID=A0ABT8B9M2_9NEIS|nr:putative quinol monooxygenase [Chitinimonas viridis]MDN3578734.1 putative quinol monooxygenase [Chitinimonas viridis]